MIKREKVLMVKSNIHNIRMEAIRAHDYKLTLQLRLFPKYLFTSFFPFNHICCSSFSAWLCSSVASNTLVKRSARKSTLFLLFAREENFGIKNASTEMPYTLSGRLIAAPNASTAEGANVMICIGEFMARCLERVFQLIVVFKV